MNKNRMTSSVAMTLYNGEKYLRQQLESIYYQTVAVDELIACDDGSSDKTEQIFLQFVADKHLEKKWRYLKNSENKGYNENFISCAEVCHGDVVFFSDQDDVWYKEKVEVMMDIFSKYPDMLVLASTDELIDSMGNQISKRKKETKRVYAVSLQEQICSMRASGLTLGIKKEFIPDVAKFVRKYSLAYDSSIGILAALKKGMYRVDCALLAHRIHTENLSNPMIGFKERVNNIDKHIEGRKFQLKHMEALYKEFSSEMQEVEKKQLRTRIEDTKVSILAMSEKKIWPNIKLCFAKNPMSNIKLNIANTFITIMAKIRKTSEE